MNIWEWITTTTSVDSIVSTLGLGALAVLFATNRIWTIGQVNARIADLKEHQERELLQKDAAYDSMVAEKDARYAEMKESRDYYRGARLEERGRVERLTDQLFESNETARAAVHALTALGEVAAEGAA